MKQKINVVLMLLVFFAGSSFAFGKRVNRYDIKGFATKPYKGITKKIISETFEKCESGEYTCIRPSYKILSEMMPRFQNNYQYVLYNDVLSRGLLGTLLVPNKIIFTDMGIYLYEDIRDKHYEEIEVFPWHKSLFYGSVIKRKETYLQITKYDTRYSPYIPLIREGKKFSTLHILKMALVCFPESKEPDSVYLVTEYILAEKPDKEIPGYENKKYKVKKHLFMCAYDKFAQNSQFALQGNLQDIYNSRINDGINTNQKDG